MTSPSAADHGGAAYFVDQKKGEVNELKQLLKNMSVERSMKRKRDIIKKVIAYMTLGIDVSRLFTEMVMAIEIKDVVVKKMVYLYLCHYANTNPELGIMCINTLQRECINEDPMVRGLALRSMTSLGMREILEYVEQPLKKGLADISSYVRKTAVMGILKIHYLDADFIEQGGYVTMLMDMIDDVDGMVVTNALSVLDEMSRKQGGILITQKMVFGLLARLGEFSEWGLCTVLDLVCRYKPSGAGAEDETFALMNLLDPILRTANSAAVLATIKCFIHLTKGMEEIEAHLYHRTKAPILTLVTGGNAEVQFAMLRHLDIILREPNAFGVFEDEYRLFFVRYNDPNYVSQLKVQLIPLLANDKNATAIAEELSEYVRGTDNSLSRIAVSSIAEIAMRVTVVSEPLVTSLIEFVDFGIPHVLTESIKEMANVVRVHPNLQGLVLSSTSRFFRKLKVTAGDVADNKVRDGTSAISQTDVDDAMGALIWMVGEYGETLTEAPYIIEPLIDEYDESTSAIVKSQLLIATMKLFFKRPPEVHAMLGRLLSTAVNDTSNQDVHDRALLYYRLLQAPNGITNTQALFDRTILPVGVAGGAFAEKDKAAFLEQMIPEFNTISVMYGCPSEHFVNEEHQMKIATYDANNDGTRIRSQSADEVVVETAGPASSNGGVDLLGGGGVPSSSGGLLDDPLGILSGASPSAAPVAATTDVNCCVLGVEVDPEQFQTSWDAGAEAFDGTLDVSQLMRKYSASGKLPSAEAVEGAMSCRHVIVVASGAMEGANAGLKFFFYTHRAYGALDLVQLTLQNVMGLVGGVVTATVTIRQVGGSGQDSIEPLVAELTRTLNSL